MNNISGNIKEDEQEAFNIVCERMDISPDQAKGVGFLNRIMKLCSITGLSITLNYGQGENGTFTISNVPSSAPEASIEEEVEEEDEYVAPEHLNKSDADEDDDPFADS